MTTKTRRTTIGVFYCEANASWAGSHLKFVENTDSDVRKEVVLQIRSPGDVDYIRDQLNKIVDGWHKQLGTMRN